MNLEIGNKSIIITGSAEGRILRCYREAGLGLIDLEITLGTARSLYVQASVCARLPL
ncbi:hypothetical protein [Solimonas sp. SE-A11]|uniref:hypothetical protein n=1 Tax=Solimonas sp. SE-A11 TaxID=3054954 RepID=UPI00259CC685|nr:hypothetical protein [Solimonas sp. SE-A11]MDM4771444.1 hypothetical protein [Solimonas sp. SE-A11]